MQDWECTIQMPSNHIQTMMIEAYDYFDAKTIAESSTGGKLLNATPQWDDAEDDSNSSEIDGGAVLGIGILLLISVAWKWILLIGCISALCYLVIYAIKE